MYFVTARAIQARHLLNPSEQANKILGGVLARAVALTGVELHGFVVASNHVHLLVTARGNSLSSFMQHFLGNTARKLGGLVDWTGSFWERRFSAEPVLDDEAAVGRLRYILAHGVKEGLVAHPRDWPGLSCIHLLREGGHELHHFYHWAKRWKKGALCRGGDELWSDRWAEPVKLTLSPLPAWRLLSSEQVRHQVDSLVEGIVAEWSNRGEREERIVGLVSTFARDPHHRPPRAKRSPRPICHASTAESRDEFRVASRVWVDHYQAASARFRAGEWNVDFPAWAFRPAVGTPCEARAPEQAASWAARRRHEQGATAVH